MKKVSNVCFQTKDIKVDVLVNVGNKNVQFVNEQTGHLV